MSAGTRLPRMNRTIVLALTAAAAISACAKATPEQQIVNDAAAALGGRDRDPRRQDARHRRRGHQRQPRPGHDARATGQKFALSGYKRVDRRRRRPRADRADAHAELRLLPGTGAAEAGARRRRRRRLQRRRRTATRRARRTPSARDRRADLYHHPLTIVRAALDPAAKLANPRTAGNERVVDVTTAGRARFTLAIDGTTEAADARRVDDRQRQPRRRRHRDQLRRLPGRQRPEAAGAPDDEDRQVHDGRHPRDEADRRRRGRRSRGAGGRGVGRRRHRAAAGERHREEVAPRASGSSPASRTTACSSSSPIT